MCSALAFDGDYLFCYGTLGPRFEPDHAGWRADAVRGMLYDLGRHPALVDLDHPDASWVEGHVRPVTLAELAGPIDAYEGVAEGYFLRRQSRSRAGLVVWVYHFARPLPPHAVGPLSRWDPPPARGTHSFRPTYHREPGT